MSESTDINITLKDKLLHELETSSIKDFTILVDGSPVMVDGYLLYVTVKRNNIVTSTPYLKFYTRNSRKGMSSTVNVVPNGMSILISFLLRSNFYGIKLDGTADARHCSIKVCHDMRLLILESHIYRSVKELCLEENRNKALTFAFGDKVVDKGTCTQLKNAFQTMSLKTYGDLIFSTRTSKFLSRLKRREKDFYSIQRSFIPVFVNYNNVFNPLLEDPQFKKTSLYQMAVKKDRFVERGEMSCYYLTHYEICKALGLKKFMRFTPAFLYKFFVGLAYPNNPYFPSVTRDVMVRFNSNPDIPKSFKSSYSLTEFSKILQDLSVEYGKVTEGSKKDELERTINIYQSYAKQSSLMAECVQNQHLLANIGAVALDDDKNKTAAAYFDILKNATLYVEGV